MVKKKEMEEAGGTGRGRRPSKREGREGTKDKEIFRPSLFQFS